MTGAGGRKIRKKGLETCRNTSPPLASRPGTTEMTNRATTTTDEWYRKTGLFYMGPGLVFKLFYFLLLSFACPLAICVGWFILLLLPHPHVFWMGLFLFYFLLLSLFILGKVDFKIRIVTFPDKCWNSGQKVGNEQAHNWKVFSIWNIKLLSTFNPISD